MTYMGVIVFLGLIVLFASFFTVKQATAAIVERLGKFHSVRHAGLHLKIPFIDQVAKRMNLRIQQLDVMIDTKTLDNVFLKMKVSVQYQVIKEQVADAINVNTLTVEQLRTMLDEKGVKYLSKDTKTDLIGLLRANSNG